MTAIRLILAATALALAACATHRIQRVPADPRPVATREFAASMAHVAKSPWTEDNRIRPLYNGDAFFPNMLKAIKGARKSVTFETFVYKQGTAGHVFSMALAERARAGIKVHVILDAYGSRHINDDNLKHMRDSGVDFHWYSPWNSLLPYRYNHRTHRKIMVVDGKVAYTGGAGYTDRWLGDAHSPDHWRDTQYEVRGPVVRQIQDAFNNNWMELTGQELRGPDYYPPLAPAGDKTAHFSLGSPREQGDTMASTFLLAINAARESIVLEHAYFIPNRELLDAIRRARGRGVHIELIVPGEHSDMPICRTASRASLLELTRAGVEVWEYQPTMMHGKLLVVDRHFCAVGSSNFDPRSFFINDEANLNILDREFARERLAQFENDKRQCKLLTEEDLQLKPHRLPHEIWAHLVKPQL